MLKVRSFLLERSTRRAFAWFRMVYMSWKAALAPILRLIQNSLLVARPFRSKGFIPSTLAAVSTAFTSAPILLPQARPHAVVRRTAYVGKPHAKNR